MSSSVDSPIAVTPVRRVRAPEATLRVVRLPDEDPDLASTLTEDRLAEAHEDPSRLLRSHVRSCVTLADGRQMQVAIAAASLERLLGVGAPGRIGLYDEHGRCWVWLELSEVAAVAPLAELDGSKPCG